MAWPEDVRRFLGAWRVDRAGYIEFRDRLAELFYMKPNVKGGARAFRVAICGIIHQMRDWCTEMGFRAGEATARAAPEFMALHLVKEASRAFTSNSRVSWRPAVALALGLLQLDRVKLLRAMCAIGKDWKRLVTETLVKVETETAANLTRPPLPAEASRLRADGDGNDHENGTVHGAAALQASGTVDRAAVVRRVLEAATARQALGVAEWASDVEIRTAYRRMALLVHPDKCPGIADSAAAFRKVFEAYGSLS